MQKQRKIAFAEEIIREEAGGEKAQAEAVHAIPSSSIDSIVKSEVQAPIRALFESSPDEEIHVDRILAFLRERGMQSERPSVYAACSRLKAKGIIEVVKPATFILKRQGELMENKTGE